MPKLTERNNRWNSSELQNQAVKFLTQLARCKKCRRLLIELGSVEQVTELILAEYHKHSEVKAIAKLLVQQFDWRLTPHFIITLAGLSCEHLRVSSHAHRLQLGHQRGFPCGALERQVQREVFGLHQLPARFDLPSSEKGVFSPRCEAERAECPPDGEKRPAAGKQKRVVIILDTKGHPNRNSRQARKDSSDGGSPIASRTINW